MHYSSMEKTKLPFIESDLPWVTKQFSVATAAQKMPLTDAEVRRTICPTHSMLL
jgi:hypothetical protein